MGMAFFFLIAIVAVAGGIGMVTARQPVHSALFLVANLFCVAVLYLSLNAEFLAAVQVIVYAGAIMVLFLFVVTLLSPRQAEAPDHLRMQGLAGAGLAIAFLVEVGLMISSGAFSVVKSTFPPPAVNWGDNVQAIGHLLYTQYLFPFEVTSILLLVAILGASVLAKGRMN